MEEMLKRSFAEFFAQRGQPHLLKAIEQGQQWLVRYDVQCWSKEQDNINRADLEYYWNLCNEIHLLTQQIQVTSSKQNYILYFAPQLLFPNPE